MLDNAPIEPGITKAPVSSCDTTNYQMTTGTQHLQEGHDLSCLHHQDEEVIKIYDILNPPKHRKRKIPEIVIHNKIYSRDYVHCAQQNGRHYGFLPLNDLMVYTGEEIVWPVVPSIVEAHKIIRNSQMPNFMKARFPVQSQFNITA